MGEAIVVLSPHVRRQENVETRELIAPRNLKAHFVPPTERMPTVSVVSEIEGEDRYRENLLLMLVHHACDDVDEGLVRTEKSVSSGQQISL